MDATLVVIDSDAELTRARAIGSADGFGKHDVGLSRPPVPDLSNGTMRGITGTERSATPGPPYDFKNAETSIDDFFNEAERVLRKQGIGMAVVRGQDIRRPK